MAVTAPDITAEVVRASQRLRSPRMLTAPEVRP